MSFQNQINGVHGSVHVRTGGDMGGVPTAAYDPIFYLHHANIDRLWADWQTAHPGPLPAAEAGFHLQPFPRPYSIAWQTGADVESTGALGYRYRRVLLPDSAIQVVGGRSHRLAVSITPAADSVRVVVKSHHMQPAARRDPRIRQPARRATRARRPSATRRLLAPRRSSVMAVRTPTAKSRQPRFPRAMAVTTTRRGPPRRLASGSASTSS